MIQLYTGKGKGKTTAAFGLAVRALGQNKKVRVVQFMKKNTSGENLFFKRYKNIKIYCYGSNRFCKKESLTKKDFDLANQAFDKAKELSRKRNIDLLILDELSVAVYYGLVDINDVILFIKSISRKIEVVITGRYAHKAIKRTADLVSEIKESKHYYRKGIKSRKGIEY